MKKKLYHFLSFVLLLCLVFPATGHAASKFQVFLDGILVNAEVIEKNKVNYLDIKALAESSGITYSYDAKAKNYTVKKNENTIKFKLNDKTYTLNGKKKQTTYPAFSSKGKTMVSTQFFTAITGKEFKVSKEDKIFSFGNYSPTETGNIKGSITWQYNQYIGTKPDIGAKVALIPTTTNNKINSPFFALTNKQTEEDNNNIHTAVVDGNGYYNIDDVPAGKYFLYIYSNNTNSDMTVDSYDYAQFSKIFDHETMEILENHLKLQKYKLKEVTIKQNKTITESHDFGYTYF
ncbi:copper amine oxidase N-terminal domain-containing protein [Virgibacillus sp. LDC1]|uniref:stalk domain-containing protein n=1 Tax=Paenibacillus sp. 843 TaxID=3341795 RepID=UPI0037271343|nr:copper amine oxidase N-terminal domain-containing protein [Virgibacillus sp. LDC1]